MKTLPRSNFIAVLAGVALALYAQVSAAPLLQQPNAAGAAARYVPGEVLVKFKPAAFAQERTASIAALGHTVLAHLDQPGWMHVKIGTDQTVETALAAYRSDPNVESAQPNYIYHAAVAVSPNDPSYGQLWAFKNTGPAQIVGTFLPNHGTAGDDMNIELAWGRNITDCSSVVVAVVDSGVNYNQEDLAANMWVAPGFPKHGSDFVDNDLDPMDLNGHGTHVAGIIGAVGNNGLGTTGVCWTASIMAVRVLDATGSGDDVTIMKGVNFAVANGAKVINMSLGGGGFSQVLSDAITTAQNSGVVVVVAAGNGDAIGIGVNNDVTPTYPCNFTQSNLICVAALDPNFALASFSNFGATSVDVGAPGTNILSTFAGTTAKGPFDSLTTWAISGGWTHVVSPSLNNFLVDPAPFTVAKYVANLSDTATNGFDTSAVDGVVLNFSAAINLANSGDSFVVGAGPNGGDPFAGGPLTGSIPGPFHGPTPGAVTFLPLDISPCGRHANCVIGFKLATGPSTLGDFGIGITGFSIDTLTLTTSTYQVDTGTSMATPMVAGLAAMLRAFNGPQFTFADTVNAIKNGGRPLAALAGKTTTGKAVDVMSSLAFIAPPTGLSATVQ